MRVSASATAAAGLLLAGNAVAIDVNAADPQSVKDAASTIAASVMSYYQGDKGDGAIPGLFPPPYYWWEGGLAFDTMIYYAAVTGDHQYDEAISQAMTFQVGPDNNYMPPNQSKSLGNDDQSTWALAAMTAEEVGFPAPDLEGVDSWLQLAQNVFDSQTARWDNETCDGGLRWQIFAFNNGYNYKNAMSNGNFMQLAARLYAKTQDETYATWFNTTAEWMIQAGLLNNETGAVFDGTSVQDQCGDLNHLQWTASTGTVLAAFQYMVDYGNLYPSSLTTILETVQTIFSKNDVLTEPACIPGGTCNVDQQAFRTILARALIPFQGLVSGESEDSLNVDSILSASAEAAGAQCSGGDDGTTCGTDWTASEYDGTMGLGQSLSALSIMLANMPRNFQSFPGGSSGSSSSNSTNLTTGTSSGGPSVTSSNPDASTSVEVQDENRGEAHAASMFGLLGALGFAVAFFL